MKKNLFISFSGGETSAFMTIWILNNIRDQYNDVVVIFANTGQENEETLLFVQWVSDHFGIPVIWVEAVVNPEKRKGTTHKVVDFKTANRIGDPFEDVIKKYGIPNASYLHCTRELKQQPMYSYVKRVLEWKKGEFDVAIGIRGDEIDRMDAKYEEKNFIYPLISMIPASKPMVNEWWAKQPRRLRLKGYQGNCKWCWKKSLRKHLTIHSEHPEFYDFPERMEGLYGVSGHNVDGTKRVFMRKSLPIKDFRIIASDADFVKADDDAAVYPEDDLFGYELDIGQGCSESCDVQFEDFGDEVIE